jgi:hypothetical protein
MMEDPTIIDADPVSNVVERIIGSFGADCASNTLNGGLQVVGGALDAVRGVAKILDGPVEVVIEAVQGLSCVVTGRPLHT